MEPTYPDLDGIELERAVLSIQSMALTLDLPIPGVVLTRSQADSVESRFNGQFTALRSDLELLTGYVREYRPLRIESGGTLYGVPVEVVVPVVQ